MDAAEGLQDCDGQLPDLFRAWEISYLIVYNKSDLLEAIPAAGEHEIDVSALRSEGIHELKGRIARLNQARSDKRIIGDLLPMRCGSGRADHQLRHADRLYERNSGTEPRDFSRFVSRNQRELISGREKQVYSNYWQCFAPER